MTVEEDAVLYPYDSSCHSYFENNVEHDESVKIAAKKSYNEDNYNNLSSTSSNTYNKFLRPCILPGSTKL